MKGLEERDGTRIRKQASSSLSRLFVVFVVVIAAVVVVVVRSFCFVHYGTDVVSLLREQGVFTTGDF